MAVKYSSTHWPALKTSVPWSMRYISPDEDDTVCFISIEGRKHAGGVIDDVNEGEDPIILVHGMGLCNCIYLLYFTTLLNTQRIFLFLSLTEALYLKPQLLKKSWMKCSSL
jgi:hypothetical protein